MIFLFVLPDRAFLFDLACISLSGNVPGSVPFRFRSCSYSFDPFLARREIEWKMDEQDERRKTLRELGEVP
ncbi:MAG: hypothetical protein IPL87_00385 [Candidatus Moraniibacteriota bacterium]|nr:MAG: hypothetical protein IPL87_00385 [Candidatus Moranbacteria bacterium]